MFETYQNLIDSTSLKGIIWFFEREETGSLKAARFFSEGREIELPLLNTVIMPEKAAKYFGNVRYLEHLVLEEWSLKFILEKAKKFPELPEAEGEEFYAYALHHGYDCGHHGEPTVTALFIHAETLDATPEKLIEPGSQFHAALKSLEDYEAFYTGEGANPNPQLRLEQKIKDLRDSNLYSWGKRGI